MRVKVTCFKKYTLSRNRVLKAKSDYYAPESLPRKITLNFESVSLDVIQLSSISVNIIEIVF